LLRRAIWQQLTYVSEVLATYITRAMVMDAASTSDVLMTSYQITRPYNPEDISHHTRSHDNLKL
jgi:hypothetical protein